MVEKIHGFSRWMTRNWRLSPALAHGLVNRKIFKNLLYALLGVVLYYLLPALEVIEGETLFRISHRLCIVFVIACLLLVINGLLLLVLDLYNTKDKQRSRPMKGLIQVFQVLLFFVGAIFMVSVLIDKSPATLFAGLGASAAILMLVFKDTILGFVAGVQLSANDMIRLGDWVQLPDGSANGIVLEITLNTVKIQNWDNTISTVPPYTLVNTTFRNWRGMQLSGGRQVNKQILLDAESLCICTEDLLMRIAAYSPLMADVVRITDTSISNAQLFRLYIERFLQSHPQVNASLDLIISQKEPSQYGIPIQVYFFLYQKEWQAFEQLQSDIFDHLLVSLRTFDLRLYQLGSLK